MAPESETSSKTTALIDSIVIREYKAQQARVRTLEQAVTVHEVEIDYWQRTLEALRQAQARTSTSEH
jgi:hypothetical protein